jgi:PAS domain S-box-containing protein
LQDSNRQLQCEIAEHARAEEALRQSYEELRTIYDATIDGMLIADHETGRFLRANSAICQMLGYTEAELLARSVADIHPATVVPSVKEKFRTHEEGERLLTVNRALLRSDGTIFYADIANTRISYQGRPCIIGFFRDITERKQAQEALERERQTLKHLLQASDHERQLIAYEIHDGLTQQIAAAIMQLQAYEHFREQPERAKTAMAATVEMLHLAYSEARRLISGVRPPVLDEAGLETAIAHLVHDERVFHGPKIEYKSEVQFDRLPRILENALYRIAQETLANACRHSGSEKVCVYLTQEGQTIRLEVQDWGVGFDPQAVGDGHFGLQGIRERVRLLDGKVLVQSGPNQGTLVQVEVPLLAEESPIRK